MAKPSRAANSRGARLLAVAVNRKKRPAASRTELPYKRKGRGCAPPVPEATRWPFVRRIERTAGWCVVRD
jgi:hypothetical protein